MKAKLLILLLTICTIANAQITPANNTISVDITLPQSTSYTYDSAFVSCRNLGMKQTGLFFTWTAIETSPHVFNFSNLDIANIYYPAYNTPIDITIAPIATNHLEVPSDLANFPLDSSIVINRFKILLDSIFAHIPSLQLSSMEIGSEMDVYLGTNSVKWTQYTNFYSAVSAYAKTLRNNLKIASEATFNGLTGSTSTYMQTLNTYSDYIAVSYYPLNSNFTVKPVSTIPTDFASIIALYPSKPIYFTQYGYPSSSVCNSSNTLQSQFIQQTFTSWDTYSSHIKMIDFTWMHDLSPASINYYSTYYGITDTVFLNYLGSLGLRTYSGNGTNNPAYDELICQAKQRGYNTLTCITGISEIEKETNFTVFPNPFTSETTLKINDNVKNLSLTIYNAFGQEVKQEKNISAPTLILKRENLPSGVYFLRLTQDNKVIATKQLVITN